MRIYVYANEICKINTSISTDILISRMGSCYVGSQEKCKVMAVAVAGDGEKDYENDEKLESIAKWWSHFDNSKHSRYIWSFFFQFQEY